MQKFIIKIEKNQKIRDFLLNYGFSKKETNKILKNKDVKINDIRINQNDYVFAGQEIVVYANEDPKEKFKTVYEDENVIVLNKNSGVEVQGENGLEGLITNSIAVHRLDRNTCGLLIMAKNQSSEIALKKAFLEKNIEKKYICEVYGQTNFKGEVFKAFLVKDQLRSEVKIYSKYVKNAVEIQTKFLTVKNSSETSLVIAELLTGKTHQIRAHLAFLGHPIIGDGKYGKNSINKKFKEKYQKLYCFSLKINKIDENFKYLLKKEFISKPDWAKKYI